MLSSSGGCWSATGQSYRAPIAASRWTTHYIYTGSHTLHIYTVTHTLYTGLHTPYTKFHTLYRGLHTVNTRFPYTGLHILYTQGSLMTGISDATKTNGNILVLGG